MGCPAVQHIASTVIGNVLFWHVQNMSYYVQSTRQVKNLLCWSGGSSSSSNILGNQFVVSSLELTEWGREEEEEVSI